MVQRDGAHRPAVPRERAGAGRRNAVTFEPGAWTAWRTHPLGQVLVVTAGCGRVQREGGPVEEIRPSIRPPSIPACFHPRAATRPVLEATYQYQAAPWWQIQPDIQYVVNPGGGIANPDNPTQRLKRETVLGVRTSITF
jgi:hypothetical protein